MKNFSLLISSILSCLSLILLLTLVPVSVYGQPVEDIYSTPGDYTFTVPDGVTSITIHVWGGGGAGGGAIIGAGGGGGGGAYNQATRTVTPGEIWMISVGAGGAMNGASGERTTVELPGGISRLEAEGGSSGQNVAGTSVNINGGTVYLNRYGAGGPGAKTGMYYGGDGGTPIGGLTVGAGGGGGAGSGGNGGDGGPGTFGLGGIGSYPGGWGGFPNVNIGVPGGSPGGGGGGAYGVNTFGQFLGGPGGNGQAIISYEMPVCTPPAFTACPTNITQATDALSCDAVVNYTVSAIGDEAMNYSYTFTGATSSSGVGTGSGSNFNVGTTDITVIASNECSPDATCNFSITIEDQQQPILTVEADKDIILDADCQFTVPDVVGGSSAEDNCPGVVITQDPMAGTMISVIPNGLADVRVTATDAAGNTDVKTVSLTAKDITPPEIISCPAEVWIEDAIYADPAGIGYPSAVDNCSGEVAMDYNDVILAGECQGNDLQVKHTIERTWTITDHYGNTSTCTHRINIVDTTPPLITEIPVDPLVQSNDLGECGAIAIYPEIVITDNTTFDIIPEFDPPLGTFLEVGTTPITVSAEDECGNTSFASFSITIEDNEAPELNCPAEVTVEIGSETTPEALGLPIVTDNCDANPTITSTDAILPGSCTSVFTIERTWLAVDATGNSATCLQLINIVDTTEPSFTVIPTSPISQTTDPGQGGAFVTYPEIVAIDNSLGPVDIATDPLTGSYFDLGTTTVTVTAIDECGNSITASFEVEVTKMLVEGELITLLNSNDKGLPGGTIKYYSKGWHTVEGETDENGKIQIDLPENTVPTAWKMYYAGASMQKNNPEKPIVFHTVNVTMDLVSSESEPLVSEDAKYYASGWKQFGDGATSANMELLPNNYPFKVYYKGGSNQISQDVSVDPNVVFNTVNVNMHLLSSTSDELEKDNAKYYASGWKTFGSEDSHTSMELLPNNYPFKVYYLGGSNQMSQDVGLVQDVVFRTVRVNMDLIASDGQKLEPDNAKYYASGWKQFVDGVTIPGMELLPKNYPFKVYYKGGSNQKSQDVGMDPNVVFQTGLVTMNLISSEDDILVCDDAKYYASGWKTFGSEDSHTSMELLPNNYPFKIYYAGGAIQKSQQINHGSIVEFSTTKVTMKLELDGSLYASTNAKYYASGWKQFGAGITETSMELLPINYPFKVYYNGTSEQLSQDVGINPLVVFNITSSGSRIAVNTTNDEKDKLTSDRISIFPNPTTDILTVEFKGDVLSDKEGINIHLFSLTGVDMIHNHKRSVNNGRMEIDLNSIPSGVYILVIPTGEHSIKRKITKL